MLPQAALIAVASAALFGALALMSDRKAGALYAQFCLAGAGACLFLAIVLNGPLAGITPNALAAFALGLFSAAGAGMLYHFYLGRFENVWTARGIFSGVYLGLSALFGLVFLSLI